MLLQLIQTAPLSATSYVQPPHINVKYNTRARAHTHILAYTLQGLSLPGHLNAPVLCEVLPHPLQVLLIVCVHV